MDESSAPAPASTTTDRLDSWKEIAAYLRRGARTVQRWERDEGLPVHRLQHEKLGSVYAYRTELDAWWETRKHNSIHVSPAELPSVAVLPFADLTRERDQDYFCEGIAEEILTALSRISGLRVASRMASFRYRNGASDPRTAGEELGVRHLLEGSVRRAANRLRISVRLSDSESGYQMWSETYDRGLEDIFAVQEEIANSVTSALRVTLGPTDRAALARVPTRIIEAYDLYLRGRKFYYGYGPRDMDFAIQLFARAIAVDNGFAQAYAGLADCWSYLYLYSTRDQALCEQAIWASGRAVELDPASGQAHASRGLALSLRGEDLEAEAEFERAAALEPGLFEAWYFYARHSFARGQHEKAVRLYVKASEVRPEDYQSPLLVAQSYECLDRPAEAAASRKRGVELAEKHLATNPDDVRALYMAANGMVGLGLMERGREFAARARTMRPDDPMTLYNLGCIYARTGAVDEAFDCLHAAVDHGLTQRGWFENDGDLAPVRSDARFGKLLARLP